MRRRLDQEMVRRGLVTTRNAAQVAIDANRVTVGGAPAMKAARQVAIDEPIELLGPPRPYVGRGGEKLAAALDRFEIEVTGKRCADIGASVGGFSDVLLQRGAREVYAVDVGKGQLHDKLRRDERVKVEEGVNARHLGLSHVDQVPVDLAVVDVSFISLRLVTPAVMGVTRNDSDVVFLVKPQFEATRQQVSKGNGVVRDPEVWMQVLTRLNGVFSAQNLYLVGLMPSPLKGAEGNVEFLGHLRKDGPRRRVGVPDFEAAIEAAVAM